jgi:NADPH-dependent 2,4-dienoyl-CoA reductase/sulfur reductase-like enzyme
LRSFVRKNAKTKIFNVTPYRRNNMKEDDVEKRSISRRNFLKTAGGVAAIAGLAGSGIPMMAGNAQAADALPKKWDETYDVVVIGSGFAGLAAAIEARNAGATVVVIDKMPVHGGNSIINGGDFCAQLPPFSS